jgi:hypothetical protein
MDCSLVSVRDRVSVAVLPAVSPVKALTWSWLPETCPNWSRLNKRSAKKPGSTSRQSLLTPQISVPFSNFRKGLAPPPAFFTRTPQRYKNRTCLRRLLKRRSAI